MWWKTIAILKWNSVIKYILNTKIEKLSFYITSILFNLALLTWSILATLLKIYDSSLLKVASELFQQYFSVVIDILHLINILAVMCNIAKYSGSLMKRKWDLSLVAAGRWRLNDLGGNTAGVAVEFLAVWQHQPIKAGVGN